VTLNIPQPNVPEVSSLTALAISSVRAANASAALTST
jgi:hypothetical protein